MHALTANETLLKLISKMFTKKKWVKIDWKAHGSTFNNKVKCIIASFSIPTDRDPCKICNAKQRANHRLIWMPVEIYTSNRKLPSCGLITIMFVADPAINWWAIFAWQRDSILFLSLYFVCIVRAITSHKAHGWERQRDRPTENLFLTHKKCILQSISGVYLPGTLNWHVFI